MKYFNATAQIDLWKSNGMSEENIENITKSDRSFAPLLIIIYYQPEILMDTL